MRYRLMNDYSVDWPFWGGEEDPGLCADGDPSLPTDLAVAVRAWAARFNAKFSWEHGWPDEETAAFHRAEGELLHRKVKEALPGHDVALMYWETAVRS
ncbi:hypothetical protein [Microbacterium trichothecenolyticum]|uniref:Uncharacterized protein n=1 Tax=Microbacterium trichothecenolyticum TaxID=69370 RepID=A0ABU0TUX3_MICTR|nr:hypothetical protein [Microbacterium trichothecenolyticum]MDQ1123456.1 hypothetical protein [Microbacterium trichothecenolyticum]